MHHFCFHSCEAQYLIWAPVGYRWREGSRLTLPPQTALSTSTGGFSLSCPTPTADLLLRVLQPRFCWIPMDHAIDSSSPLPVPTAGILLLPSASSRLPAAGFGHSGLRAASPLLTRDNKQQRWSRLLWRGGGRARATTPKQESAR